ncbi:MAG TPA: hypothetical protein VF538_02700 [Pyrinomonadaceae bacterium]|jgi:hypothetical protein
MTTRRIFAVSLLLMLTGLFAYAQDAAKTVTVKGYLTDNMCAGSPTEDKDFAEDAKEHSVGCARMPHCVKSGYAVAEGRKLYKLDDAGNKLAAKVLKTTEREKGVMVEVEGTVEGTTLHVTKLVEVAAK